MNIQDKIRIEREVAANLAGLTPSPRNHPDNYERNRAEYARLDLAAWRRACREKLDEMEAEAL